MLNLSKPTLKPTLRMGAGLAAGLLLVGACASAPPAPTQSLQAARSAIENAEKADAGRYAAVELSEARKQLAAADASVREERMLVARRLALQSRAQAELATAKTQAVKANAVNDEMRNSTRTLIEEMKRTSGERS